MFVVNCIVVISTFSNVSDFVTTHVEVTTSDGNFVRTEVHCSTTIVSNRSDTFKIAIQRVCYLMIVLVVTSNTVMTDGQVVTSYEFSTFFYGRSSRCILSVFYFTSTFLVYIKVECFTLNIRSVNFEVNFTIRTCSNRYRVVIGCEVKTVSQCSFLSCLTTSISRCGGFIRNFSFVFKVSFVYIYFVCSIFTTLCRTSCRRYSCQVIITSFCYYLFSRHFSIDFYNWVTVCISTIVCESNVVTSLVVISVNTFNNYVFTSYCVTAFINSIQCNRTICSSVSTIFDTHICIFIAYRQARQVDDCFFTSYIFTITINISQCNFFVSIYSVCSIFDVHFIFKSCYFMNISRARSCISDTIAIFLNGDIVVSIAKFNFFSCYAV